ncbi:hypothetical protein Sjap_007742 [Stephania japonica]|uniref:Uncharacterized protein n=1 Tax=Stephania japonica TaxID=461633 RepID=A0AAP0JPU2_9MAGN
MEKFSRPGWLQQVLNSIGFLENIRNCHAINMPLGKKQHNDNAAERNREASSATTSSGATDVSTKIGGEAREAERSSRIDGLFSRLAIELVLSLGDRTRRPVVNGDQIAWIEALGALYASLSSQFGLRMMSLTCRNIGIGRAKLDLVRCGCSSNESFYTKWICGGDARKSRAISSKAKTCESSRNRLDLESKYEVKPALEEDNVKWGIA